MGPTDEPTDKPQGKYPVSVCKDATYFLDTEAVCGGSIDGEATGTACPVTGDSSTDPSCLPDNPSYDANSTKCVAPVDAVCPSLNPDPGDATGLQLDALLVWWKTLTCLQTSPPTSPPTSHRANTSQCMQRCHIFP